MGRLSRGEYWGLRHARVREQGIGDPSSPLRLRLQQCLRFTSLDGQPASPTRPGRLRLRGESPCSSALHGGRAVQRASKTSGLGEPVLALPQSPERRAAGFAAINAARCSCPRMTPESGATSAFSAEDAHNCAVSSAAYRSERRAPGSVVANPARPSCRGAAVRKASRTPGIGEPGSVLAQSGSFRGPAVQRTPNTPGTCEPALATARSGLAISCECCSPWSAAVPKASKTSGLGVPGSARAQSAERRALGFAVTNQARRCCPRMAPACGTTSASSAGSGYH